MAPGLCKCASHCGASDAGEEELHSSPPACFSFFPPLRPPHSPTCTSHHGTDRDHLEEIKPSVCGHLGNCQGFFFLFFLSQMQEQMVPEETTRGLT